MAEPAAAPAAGVMDAIDRTAAVAPPADEPQTGFTRAAPDAEASRLSFRQWLLNGGGLYGVSGERQPGRKRSAGRKKVNLQSRGARHSPAGGSDASGPTVSVPTMEAREVYSGGKKKTRRWLNDLLLRELAGPLDASDVAALYAPPPWGHKTERPALERITEISPWHAERLDRALWDIILSSDMDQRDKFLRLPPHATTADAIRGLRKEAQGQAQGALDAEGTGLSGSGRGSASAAALLAWRGVSPAAKEALKRSAQWPVLALLEDKILLLKDCAEPSREFPEAHAHAGQEPAQPVSGPQLTGGLSASTEACVAGAQDGNSSHLEAAGREEGTPASAVPHPGATDDAEKPGAQQPLTSSPEATPSSTNCPQTGGAESVQSVSQASGAAEGGGHAVAGGQSAGRGKQERAVIFSADDSFQRLLIHGLCQFHGLASSSLTPKEAQERAQGWRIEEGEDDWEAAQKVVLVCQPASLGHHPGLAWVPPLRFRLSDILNTV